MSNVLSMVLVAGQDVGTGSISPRLEIALQVGTVLVLTVTLIVTARLARSTQMQARAARDQADLLAVVEARPLLSVSSLTLRWEDGRPSSVEFEVSNAGRGAAFNVAVSLEGVAQSWSVQWHEDKWSAYGALCSGCNRSFIATVARDHTEPQQFGNQLSFMLECFDVLRSHYRFDHAFLVRQDTQYAKEAGLSLSVRQERS